MSDKNGTGKVLDMQLNTQEQGPPWANLIESSEEKKLTPPATKIWSSFVSIESISFFTYDGLGPVQKILTTP